MDVIDGEGEVAEIAPACIFFRVPVVGQFDLGFRAFVGGQKNQGIAPRLVVLAPGFLEAQFIAEKIQAKLASRGYVLMISVSP